MGKDALKYWAHEACQPHRPVKNFAQSWQDGIAFIALLAHTQKVLGREGLAVEEFDSAEAEKNLAVSFDGFAKLGVPKMLSVQLVVDGLKPDGLLKKAMITYLASIHNRLKEVAGAGAVKSSFVLPADPTVADVIMRRKRSYIGKFRDVVGQCGRVNTPYADKEFPASEASIGKNSEDPDACEGPGGPLVWRRAKDIFGKEAPLFDGPNQGVHPCDIAQGGLGDCYLLAAISAIAEHPHRIKNLFCTMEGQGDGPNKWSTYGVKLCVDGGCREIVVDDYFPCWERTGEPSYATNKSAKIWVMLLEKAYAKAYGSYQMIAGGQAGDALSDILGAPYRSYEVNPHMKPAELDAVWKRVADADAADYVMCGGVNDHPGVDLEKTVGIIEGHAYSLLHACQLSTGERLVALRNPWGKTEWKGAWSDDSELWTEEAKREVARFGGAAPGSSHAQDDGSFWMAFDDYVKYFSDVQVCFFNDRWIMESLMTELKNEDPNIEGDGAICETWHFSFVLEGRMKGTIALCQARRPAPIALRFCIMRQGEPVGGTTESFCFADQVATQILDLAAGEYEVRVQVHDEKHVTKTGRPVVLVVYGERSATELKLLNNGGSRDFVLPEDAERFGRCDICKTVLGATSVKELGKRWCTSCFACIDCKASQVGQSFYIKNGYPWCENCKMSDASTCGNGRHGCGKPINGSYAVALDAEWHPECLVCATCNGPLNAFYVQGNRPFCSEQCIPC